jgi:hypothetical protein
MKKTRQELLQDWMLHRALLRQWIKLEQSHDATVADEDDLIDITRRVLEGGQWK